MDLPVLSPEKSEEIAEAMRIKLSLEIDWKSYYDEFSRKHGGHPEEYGGRFIFRDGWAYALDYEGPEWPPPKKRKDLLSIQAAYWSLRCSRLRIEKKIIQNTIEKYNDIERGRDCNLHYVRNYIVENGELTRRPIPDNDVVLDLLYKNTVKELANGMTNLERILQLIGSLEGNVDDLNVTEGKR